MNLLRPEQRSEMLAERDVLRTKLSNPHIEDKGAVAKQLRNLETQLETQTPKPYKPTEIDAAVRRERELREQLLAGMPSQEEMRKNPPGAVGKHMEWERRNKQRLLEWKEIRLRLNHDNADPDVANFERFRPTTSTLNMDNAQIPGTQYFMPPTSPQYQENFERIFGKKEKEKKEPEKPKKKKRVLTEEQREALRARMMALHERRRALKEAPPEASSQEG